MAYSRLIQELIDQLGRLPGVGPKSAQRIADYILTNSPDDAAKLTEAISEAKAKVRFCDRCFNFAEDTYCTICNDTDRDPALLCVIEKPRDIQVVEKTGEFRGRYHVLQGAINPIEGIGPDQLRIKELLVRLDTEGIKEVILTTNPNIEGEATAMYIARLLQPFEIVVSRIASGLPVGGDLEYADELTLGKAMTGRREVQV